MAVFLIRKPRCVFIHIPKTGGSSIRLGFFANRVSGPKQGFIPKAWQNHFKVTFVRNPYDRVISAWKMFRSGMHDSIWQRPEFHTDLSLPQFLAIVTDESIAFSGNRQTTPEKIRHHSIPQTHPYNCLEHADYIGRFESLETDFAEVCQRLEIPFERLPHWNRTDRETDYMQYFDAASLAMVNDFYRADLAELNYPVAMPDS